MAIMKKTKHNMENTLTTVNCAILLLKVLITAITSSTHVILPNNTTNYDIALLYSMCFIELRISIHHIFKVHNGPFKHLLSRAFKLSCGFTAALGSLLAIARYCSAKNSYIRTLAMPITIANILLGGDIAIYMCSLISAYAYE